MRKRECTCGWMLSGAHELSCGLPDPSDVDWDEYYEDLDSCEQKASQGAGAQGRASGKDDRNRWPFR